MGATGAVTNLASHAGTVGSTLEGVAGASGLSAQYQEAPTIRYQPVQGQALFTQISAPITVDTLSALFGSDWGLGPMFAYAFDQWVPGYTDNAAALNMMIWLDSCGAIGLAATRSDFSGEREALQRVSANGASINIQTQPAASGANDLLDLYLESKRSGCSSEDVTRVWGWLWKLYAGTQPGADGSLSERRPRRSASHRAQDLANKEHPGPRHRPYEEQHRAYPAHPFGARNPEVPGRGTETGRLRNA